MGGARLVYLVVGGDSLIGSALLKSFQASGETALVTTRCRATTSAVRLYLDLADDDVGDWQCPSGIKVAFLCAGVTRIKACADDPAASRRTNVAGISALAARLVVSGVFVVYLSTNQVFDGSTPSQAADAPYSPTTEYGRQKAEAERNLLAFGDLACVVRLSKILPDQAPLFTQWVTSLKDGQIVRPISDVVLAPIPLVFCVEVLRRTAAARASGIIQVSGDRDITYADAAYHIARHLPAAGRLVQAVPSDEAGCDLGPPRSNTTLDTSRLHDAFGLQVPDVWMTVNSAAGLSR